MLYTKDGYPQVNEIVLCVVTKIMSNTTFVSIPEYEKEGVLTISEIAPGRIRNLRDHVVEEKTIVCKVLRIDENHKRIDVSLRRVPVQVMKDKLEEIKKESYAERVYLDIAKELNSDKDTLFEKTYEPIFENYETVFEALYDIMLDDKKVDMFANLNEHEKGVFVRIINDRIKPEEVIFKEKFELTSTDENGARLIRDSISNSLEPLNYDNFEVYYLAAGKFGVTITHDDIKSAQKLFNSFRDNLVKEAKNHNLNINISQ